MRKDGEQDWENVASWIQSDCPAYRSSTTAQYERACVLTAELFKTGFNVYSVFPQIVFIKKDCCLFADGLCVNECVSVCVCSGRHMFISTPVALN